MIIGRGIVGKLFRVLILSRSCFPNQTHRGSGISTSVIIKTLLLLIHNAYKLNYQLKSGYPDPIVLNFRDSRVKLTFIEILQRNNQIFLKLRII